MKQFIVLTLYPDIFTPFLSDSLIGKAREENKISIETINFRQYGIGKHKKVDSSPYGGGPGMVLRPEPIDIALNECEKKIRPERLYKVLISPQGAVYNQDKAKMLCAIKEPIALICGRFEGFDERIRELVDDDISIGDFILMGGEVAAMAIIESVCRLIPGVIGNNESSLQESFAGNLLEYAQYTKPLEFRDSTVPEVLTSGNHQMIDHWRTVNAEQKTRNKRKDLYYRYLLNNKTDSTTAK